MAFALVFAIVMFEGATPWMAQHIMLPRMAEPLASPLAGQCLAGQRAAGWADTISALLGTPEQGLQVAAIPRRRLAGFYMPARDVVVLDADLCRSDALWRLTVGHEHGHVFQARYGRALTQWWELKQIPRATGGYAATSPVEQQAEAIAGAMAMLSTLSTLPVLDADAGVLGAPAPPRTPVPHSTGVRVPAPVSLGEWLDALRPTGIQLLIATNVFTAEELAHWELPSRRNALLEVGVAIGMAEDRVPGTIAMTRLLLTHPLWAQHPLRSRPDLVDLLLGPATDPPVAWQWPETPNPGRSRWAAGRLIEMWLSSDPKPVPTYGRVQPSPAAITHETELQTEPRARH